MESLADLFRRAQELLRSGRETEGAAELARILKQVPDHPPTHHILGTIALRRQDCRGAVRHLAMARRALGEERGIGESYRQALAGLCGDGSDALALSEALVGLSLWPEACEVLQPLLTNECRRASVWDLSRRIAEGMLDLEGALRAARRTVECAPDQSGTWVNLGNVLLLSGRIGDCRRAYEKAMTLDPAAQKPRAAMAMLELLGGNFESGWRLYESRAVAEKVGEVQLGLPIWKGEDAAGRSLVVYTEQGLGTILQFARLLPELRRKGMHITLLAPKCLVPLLGGAKLADEVHAWKFGDEFPTSADFAVSLMSLPGLLRVSEERSFSGELPLYQPEEALVAEWRDKLGASRGLRVCLHWQGSVVYTQDRWRSPSLAAFDPLLQIPGIEWISLQRGEAVDDAMRPPYRGVLQTLPSDADPIGHAFRDSAAILATSDLLITADSAIAHLAGSLGRPVWLLLARIPDWRWGLEGERTAWYPSMRLIRQTKMGDWEAPMLRAAERLEKLRAADLANRTDLRDENF